MGLPAVLLSAEAVVLAASGGGRVIIEVHSALRIEGGQLRLRRAEEAQALSEALHRLLAERDAERIVLLLRSRGGKPVLLLRLARVAFDQGNVALCEFTDLETGLGNIVELASILGLTKAQATVVSHLVRGLNVPDIAVKTGLKESTLRTHIREACERLSVIGQQELALTAAQIARVTGLFVDRQSK
jgi:DNA-binding CsgD family transcriptional regulator